MGAVFFAVFILILLTLGGSSFFIKIDDSFIQSPVTYNRIKYIIKLIRLFIIGLPVSWFVSMIYFCISIITKLHIMGNFGIYLIILNTIATLSYILFNTCLRFFKKTNDKHIIYIKNFLSFLLCLNIVCTPFPIISFILYLLG